MCNTILVGRSLEEKKNKQTLNSEILDLQRTCRRIRRKKTRWWSLSVYVTKKKINMFIFCLFAVHTVHTGETETKTARLVGWFTLSVILILYSCLVFPQVEPTNFSPIVALPDNDCNIFYTCTITICRLLRLPRTGTTMQKPRKFGRTRKCLQKHWNIIVSPAERIMSWKWFHFCLPICHGETVITRWKSFLFCLKPFKNQTICV